MNRHLYGDMLPVKADVPDRIEVGAGDIMFLVESGHQNLQVGLRGTSGMTAYVYPWASGQTTSTAMGVTCPFMGIALDDSPAGSTDTIGIATAGVFEFPLTSQAGITIGKVIQAHRPTGFSRLSQTTASYEVIQNSGGGVTLGYCQKTEASAKTARVLIRTKFGPGGIVENT